MIIKNLIDAFHGTSFTLKEAYQVNPDVNQDSVRARIYENLGKAFERISRGVYMTKDEQCIVIEGDGRDLSMIKDNIVDCIITDHPWADKKSNKGGTRNFADYEVFNYELKDFKEKARILKEGSFLCEIIPAENAANYEYLYQIKQLAKKAGFEYYAKVPWKKGTFVSNTGRKAKNTEDLLIFSKGKPRKLRPDKQRGLDTDGNPTRFMSGANGMLPTCFDIQAVPRKKQIAQSEKPPELFEQLLDYLTKEGELVLDQFAGSGSVGEACIHKNRKCILIEYMKEKVERIAERLGAVKIQRVFD